MLNAHYQLLYHRSLDLSLTGNCLKKQSGTHSINHNNKEEQQNSKYEIDWYFLDNKGRMNIISYGNQTAKISKYRTFLTSVNGNTRSLGNNVNIS